MVRLRSLTDPSPRLATAAYLLIGGVWLLASDAIVYAVAPTQVVVTALQAMKGWLFVGGSAAVIYTLGRRRERRLERSNARLRETAQQLQVLGRVFRHNVRNDMTVIKGYTELVREHVTDTADEDRLRTVAATADDLIETSERLCVVNDLDISTDTTVDVASLVRQERERLRETNPTVTVDTSLPDHAVVRGDDVIRRAIRAAVECLLEQGSTATGRHVSITVEQADADDEVVVAITDDGPGIPENDLEPVRCGEETDLVHASGVRIWLLEWLCKVYGGRVVFADEQPGGTVVSLRLPAASAG
ncbi:sensor histidine kinase [Halarchaeum salinum]|uniref:histidine kinase n=1 Tax=Halarchaeum salinum TaxID=489912 RepID=A0AAV3S8X6_9EURY